jgi:hypothetical protein
MVKRLLKNSAHSGRLPAGCRHCGKGQKLVLFVTGICPGKCFYCPLSAEKRGADVVFADELRVRTKDDIVQEAELIDAAGTGITGGDPLRVLPRTIRYIRLLKDNFGDRHHIHLYTATADVKKIARLSKSGLNEIRFHPPPALWGRMDGSPFERAIRASLDAGLDTGIEVPALPGMKRELEALVSFLDSAGANFLNLNELEFSETNFRALLQRGYKVKDDISSGVAGSEELALSLLASAGTSVSIPLHYCSASYKDGVQLRNRIMRRAKNIARPGDVISDDGLLVKGVVECRFPGRTRRAIMDEFRVPARLIRVDGEKHRVEVAPWVLEKIAAKLGQAAFIIEEYPTADRLEIERTRIN